MLKISMTVLRFPNFGSHFSLEPYYSIVSFLHASSQFNFILTREQNLALRKHARYFYRRKRILPRNIYIVRQIISQPYTSFCEFFRNFVMRKSFSCFKFKKGNQNF